MTCWETGWNKNTFDNWKLIWVHSVDNEKKTWTSYIGTWLSVTGCIWSATLVPSDPARVGKDARRLCSVDRPVFPAVLGVQVVRRLLAPLGLPDRSALLLRFNF